MDKTVLQKWITVLVAALWAIAVIYSIVRSQFTVLGAVTPVMLIVVGFLFGRQNGSK